MRVAPPTLKREAAPAAKTRGGALTNGRAAAAKREKAGASGAASANGHPLARAAGTRSPVKPRRRTTTAR
jgi:hypothetical protein